MTSLFQHEDWISREYLGGLNSYFTGAASDISELLSLFEEGLQMGHLLSVMLLQKLRDTYDAADQIGQADSAVLTKRQILDFAGNIVRELKLIDA